jgi:hypothetical protein
VFAIGYSSSGAFSGSKDAVTDGFWCLVTSLRVKKKHYENKNGKYRPSDQREATRNVVKSVRIERNRRDVPSQ